MDIYKHTQTGCVSQTAVCLVLGYLLLYTDLQLFWCLPLIVIIALYSSLTVRVCSGKLIWYFGPGLHKQVCSLSQIEHADIVNNKWWYGFGIRYLPNEKLYNVSGLHAVRLKLSDGRTIRLGTDEPEELKQVITKYR